MEALQTGAAQLLEASEDIAEGCECDRAKPRVRVVLVLPVVLLLLLVQVLLSEEFRLQLKLIKHPTRGT